MIVIATHNGGEVLKHLLSDIKSFNISNDEVCIVDNISTDSTFLRYLIDLTSIGYKVLANPEPTYEIGAFKLAIEKYKSDTWFCLQDSIRLKQNIFELIPPKLTDKNVYTFLTFNFPDIVFNYPVYTFLFENYHTITYKTGVYGNMFFAKNSVVQKVKNDWVLPKNKFGSAASEIGVGLVFDKHGIEIIGMDIADERADVAEGFTAYPFFSKLPMHKYRQ